MDIYTLGRLALPGVVAIMAVAAILTLFAGVFTAVKTLTSLQRFFQQMEDEQATFSHDQHQYWTGELPNLPCRQRNELTSRHARAQHGCA